MSLFNILSFMIVLTTTIGAVAPASHSHWAVMVCCGILGFALGLFNLRMFLDFAHRSLRRVRAGVILLVLLVWNAVSLYLSNVIMTLVLETFDLA